MDNALSTRLDAAKRICREAGDAALTYFQQLDTLTIEHKGHQDLVSEADRNVELIIRDRLSAAFAEDAIVGEEHDTVVGTSGYTWVIDPIDGTSNFLAGIPAWVVVLACVHEAQTVIGVIYDPVHDELYWATRGEGAFRDGRALAVSQSPGLGLGSVGIGFSTRVRALNVCDVIAELLEQGGMFYRNASGALSLAYVADGRLLGFIEEHMNAWDCLAGQLLVSEAGGQIEDQDADAMIQHGGRVVAGCPSVFDAIQAIADQRFTPNAGTPSV